MSRSIKADGETWDVHMAEDAPHEGVRSLIFHCSSNTSWGWRVLELATPELQRLESKGGVEELPAAELQRLFERSQPFDYVHDPKAVDHRAGPPG